jgi:sec-independent protein translocase protein TatB
VFDIGIGEIIMIAVVGLLIFGPDRLPKATADATRWLRQFRAMASGARQDLADSAGIDLSETVDTVKSLQEFHPRRLAQSLLDEDKASNPAKPGNATSPSPSPAFDPDAT